MLLPSLGQLSRNLCPSSSEFFRRPRLIRPLLLEASSWALGQRFLVSPQLPLSFASTVLCEGLSNHLYLQHHNYLFQSLSHQRQQPRGQGLAWSSRPVISKRLLSPSALNYSHLGSCLSPHPGGLHFKMAQSHFTIVSRRLPQPATSRLRTLQD